MEDYYTPWELGVKPGEFLQCMRWAGQYYTEGMVYQVVEGHGSHRFSIGTKDNVGGWRRMPAISLEDQVKELLG